MLTEVDGVLFDKDGTLFEFQATWAVWARQTIEDLSGGDSALCTDLAHTLGFDLNSNLFTSDSPIIAASVREIAEHVQKVLSERTVDAIEQELAISAQTAPLAPAVPLAAFLEALKGLGLAVGVMTNDAESVAHAQLKQAGVFEQFDFVAGYDSGYGAKPSPDPLLAFANKMELSPDRILMVGDSTHDLVAGRAAGMRTVAVLTGVALEEELSPYADVVFPNIGHIPGWLAA
ncbi:Phosphoglycolate phosphatase [Roseovarius albus]|uniref:phosphoglycolate phosphatase n=1 Tax=Roseovarius albus TaxID=1247867 RepID=A0A1X6YJ72_9RHOB|nr:HAD family hydrolase [Roseovarius albus]SLN22373.1 Phosphoglycolate phosphatase [Roseovarius albus]